MSMKTEATMQTRRVEPVLEAISDAKFEPAGELRRRLNAITRQWLLSAPFANPAMLEMFRNRDRLPYQKQTPWAGEYAGKYLTGAVQVLHLSQNSQLEAHLRWFVQQLISLQDSDGYLGAWPRPWRMRKNAPNCPLPWDAWSHYHVLNGLLLWYRYTASHSSPTNESAVGDLAALNAAKRIGDYFCDRFLKSTDNPDPERLIDAGAPHANLAPLHGFCLLYQATGESRYLDLARQIERELEAPGSGDFVRHALAGKPFHESPTPQWQSLHTLLGIAELYFITGEARLRDAVDKLWWSMLESDRHNNGGFGSDSKAVGDPYHTGAIETCATVAWEALCVEQLRLTGNSIVADELEITLLNSGVGLSAPSGRWFTFNTPMEGIRVSATQENAYQPYAASTELTCCTTNGPRALGLLSQWALMRSARGLALNYFGPGAMNASLPSGNVVNFNVDTDYPRGPQVNISISPAEPESFELAIRIPNWSRNTAVRLNGVPVENATPGQYLRIRRLWEPGDTLVIHFDFRLQFWHNPKIGFLPEATDFVAQWKIYGPIPRTPGVDVPNAPPDLGFNPALSITAQPPPFIAARGISYEPTSAISRGGILDITHMFPDADRLGVAVAFTTIHSSEEDELPIIFGCDWWSQVFVNGEKIYDNFSASGNEHPVELRTHTLILKLKKGANTIAFHIAGGPGRGIYLTLGKGQLLSKVRLKPTIEKTVPVAIYRGPVLLTFDPRFNTIDRVDLPTLAASNLPERLVAPDHWQDAWLLVEYPTTRFGVSVRLCDFASAGFAGHAYSTWLPVRFVNPPTVPFTRDNPLRAFHQSPSQHGIMQ